MQRAGIIGHPVAHSLSPVFQGAAFAACGLDVVYERWDTAGDQLAMRIQSLRASDCLGANVTVPWKEAVIPMLDEVGGQASVVGAVNTIVNRDGRLFGFNTDGAGLVAALRNEAGFDPAGRTFLLLGAGGSARGIAFALADARAARVGIWNRTPSRAVLLRDALGAAGYTCEALPEPLPGFDCVINTTSAGMRGGPDPGGTPVPLAAIGQPALVVDIVYAPEATPFLAAAAQAEMNVLGGLPMLIYQGTLAFEHWTGIRAPIDVMFDAARKALAGHAP